MTAHPFLIVDAFTDRPLEGNPCAVVLEAADLDDAKMQAIARETNLSETAFVSPDGDERNAFRARYFTPETEIPFAGHPTLATVRALVDTGRIESEGGAAEVRLRRPGLPAHRRRRAPAPRLRARLVVVRARGRRQRRRLRASVRHAAPDGAPGRLAVARRRVVLPGVS